MPLFYRLLIAFLHCFMALMPYIFYFNAYHYYLLYSRYLGSSLLVSQEESVGADFSKFLFL